jgi:exopolysaccharide biosynthesis polyprenyl glycosylphosphotransferase
MKREKINLFYSLLILIGDFIGVLLAFVIAYIIRVKIDSRKLVELVSASDFLLISIAVIPFWLMSFALLGLYKKEVIGKFWKQFSLIFFGSLLGTMSFITLDFILNKPLFPARLVPVYIFLLCLGIVGLFRLLLEVIKKVLTLNGKWLTRVLVIADNDTINYVQNKINKDIWREYRLDYYWKTGVNVSNKVIGKDLRQITNMDELISVIENRKIDLVLQGSGFSDHLNERLVQAVQSRHIDYKLLSGAGLLSGSRTSSDIFFGIPILNVHLTTLRGWNLVFKRIFDVLVSIFALIFILPILLVVAIIMKIKEPKAPIFYKQVRIGRYQKKIEIYKLRTMMWKYCARPDGYKTGEEALIAMGRDDLIEEFKKSRQLANDPRITRFGRFLRKFSIDELPQIFNILKGDISLVGPRPALESEGQMYKDKSKYLYSMRPGLAGLRAVVSRNDTDFDKRIELDVYYVQNWSFWWDLKILVKAFLTIFKGTGV